MKLRLGLLTICYSVSCLVSAGEWDYFDTNITINSVGDIQDFIAQHYPIEKSKLRYQTKSLIEQHYNFDIWQNGEYQHQKTIVVSIDNQHRIRRIFHSLDNSVLINGIPTTALELEYPRQLEADYPPELSQGKLVTASTQLFDPDLRTAQQLPAPANGWRQQDDYPLPIVYQTKDIELLQVGEEYFLRNHHLVEVNVKALLGKQTPDGPVVREQGNFLPNKMISRFSDLADLAKIELNDERFAPLMAFYHLNHSIEYSKSLGYPLFNQPVKFDARGLATNNSTYYKGPNTIVFGIGGPSPDAIDADVILHELAHGIHYQIVPDWGYGHSGAIGEGFADYWAGSYSYRVQYLDPARRGQEFEIDTVFNWDGVFGPRRTTRSLWNQRARYFEHGHYRAHESVGGELGDELWSSALFQALKAAVQQYGDGTDKVFREFDTIVLQSMYGLGRGLKMHNLAESTLYAATRLYPEKDYAQILRRQFSHYDLLKSPFVVRLDQRYIDSQTPLTIALETTGRPTLVSGDWLLDTNLVLTMNQQLEHRLEISSPLPSNLVCGQAFSSQLDVRYRFQSWLSEQRWQDEKKIIVGVPKLTTPLVSPNYQLPDASSDAQGRFTPGRMIFSHTLTDRDLIIDKRFAVYLDIDHPSMSDLSITLTSPQGTKVTLWDHQSSLQSGFNGYFTVEHDQPLASLEQQMGWGRWRLEIIDQHEGHQGTLRAWGVGPFSDYQCSHNEQPSVTSPSSGGSSNGLSLLILLSILMARIISSRSTYLEPTKRREK